MTKMEAIENKDYEVLRYLADTERNYVNHQRINPKVEQSLGEQGYIDFSTEAKQLRHPDFVLTKKGYAYFCELRVVKQKDYTMWIAIGTAVAAVIAVISLLRTY